LLDDECESFSRQFVNRSHSSCRPPQLRQSPSTNAMILRSHSLASWTISFALYASAQSQGPTCENSGIPQIDSAGTTTGCSCPPGFGGETCSLAGCGDDIFYGGRRNLSQPVPQQTPPNTTVTYSNLTASECSCSNGWSGIGCNVCTSDKACQNAFDISGNAPHQDIGCNTKARVFASGMASCGIEV
jgi:hypothetical protein